MNTDQIKQQNDIERVISRYVTVTRKGNKPVALCPFHDDRHPSLHIHQQKQLFRCFSCGAGGDVITFVRMIEKCDFQTALTYLQKPEPLPTSPKGRRKEEKEEVMLPFHPLEGLLPFTACPPGTFSSPSGRPGGAFGVALSSAYLDFNVSYSPHHYKQGGKLIFPIHDKQGILRGYSARRLTDNPEEPKYTHTAAKYGFKSSHHLYGLHRAGTTIRKSGTLILVEGFKDVLALHAAGFIQAVGLMGTNLSETQLHLIKESGTDKVLIMTDGDPAGQQAAKKIKDQLKVTRLEILTATLPEGEDPESLYHQKGHAVFHTWVEDQLHPPSPEEKALITACLHHAETFLPYNGGTYKYITLVASFMENEHLSPTSLHHQQILDLLEEDPTNKTLNELKKTTPGAPASPEQLFTLIYHYCESQILRKIKTTTHHLKTETTPQKRTSHLNQLQKLREQLKDITETLHQTPALHPSLSGT